MTSVTFLRRKNDIVERVTGHILVPEDQICNVPFVPLWDDSIPDNLCGCYCPYCLIFGEFYCVDCPMARAGNECGAEGSTWTICNEIWVGRATKDDMLELQALCKEYNATKGEGEN